MEAQDERNPFGVCCDGRRVGHGAGGFAGVGSAAERKAIEVPAAGRRVRVEVYECKGGGPGPTVLICHGVGGMLGDGALMRRAARSLAARGFRAAVVHYFNVSGSLFATHGAIRIHSPEWMLAMAAVARHFANAQGAPVGVLGYSLGGFLAVGVAPTEPAIGAVAVLCGGALESAPEGVPPRLPPILILHGSRDTKVPLARAEELAHRARLAGAPVEIVTYPGEGHAFDVTAERDALRRVAEFLRARLRAGVDE